MGTKLDVNNPYNGWANYETWNVALWISSDELLHSLALDYKDEGFRDFAGFLGSILRDKTPDGVSYTDSRLDIVALDVMMRDL